MNYLIEVIQIENGNFIARYKKDRWWSFWKTIKTKYQKSKYGTTALYEIPVDEEFFSQKDAIDALHHIITPPEKKPHIRKTVLREKIFGVASFTGIGKQNDDE